MDVQKLVGIFKSLCSRLSWRLGSAHCFWREWILPVPGVLSWLMSFVCSWSESCCTSRGIAIVMLSTQNWLEMHMRRISGFLFCCYFCLPFYSGFRARFESTELDMGKNVDLTMVLFPEKCKHCWGDYVCVRERNDAPDRGRKRVELTCSTLWGQKYWLIFWRTVSVGAWNIYLHHGVLQKEAFWAYLQAAKSPNEAMHAALGMQLEWL